MVDEPIFLEVDDVILIHHDQVAEHGGALGVLDMGLLESAVEMPRSRLFGEFAHRTIFEMAAAYLFHLAKNHAFQDGNKRVAAATAETFLQLNGYEVWADEPEYSDFVLSVVAGDIPKADIAGFYERTTREAQ